MPYVSEKQRKMIYAKHPKIAAKYEKEGKNKVVKKRAAIKKKKGK